MFLETRQLFTLLVFVTGSATIPPLGFHPQPTITFGHRQDFAEPDDQSIDYPFANTCSNSLRLPVLSSSDDFCANMLAALRIATTFSAR